MQGLFKYLPGFDSRQKRPFSLLTNPFSQKWSSSLSRWQWFSFEIPPVSWFRSQFPNSWRSRGSEGNNYWMWRILKRCRPISLRKICHNVIYESPTLEIDVKWTYSLPRLDWLKQPWYSLRIAPFASCFNFIIDTNRPDERGWKDGVFPQSRIFSLRPWLEVISPQERDSTNVTINSQMTGIRTRGNKIVRLVFNHLDRSTGGLMVMVDLKKGE